jgi:hypothetical protein
MCGHTLQRLHSELGDEFTCNSCGESIKTSLISEGVANQPTPRFRWRLIPVMLFGIFAVLGTLGAIIRPAIMVYYNLKFGWIKPHPSTPSLNNIAVTPQNLAACAFGMVLAAVAMLATWAWMKARWQRAAGVTLVFVALMILNRLLFESLN